MSSSPTAYEENAALLFLYSETAVHAGTGAAERFLDDPIQRSELTGWPVFYDSTFRGALRNRLGVVAADALLGKAGSGAPSPGRLSTPEVELLAFPVASAVGIVTWVTCPLALHRFLRAVDLHTFPEGTCRTQVYHLEALVEQLGRGPEAMDRAWPADAAAVSIDAGSSRCIVLGNARFDVKPNDGEAEIPNAVEGIARWMAGFAHPRQAKGPTGDELGYWATQFCDRFVIVHDEVFTHLTRTHTEVRTRIRIEDGTVAAGALWSEENLPSDTLLFTVIGQPAGSAVEEPLRVLSNALGQTDYGRRALMTLGAEQSLGRGNLRLRLHVDLPKD